MRRPLFVMMLCASAIAWAQTQQEQADDAIAWGSAGNASVAEATEADPSTLVPGYAGEETALGDYYDGQNAAALEADAMEAVIVSPDETTDYAWEQSNTAMLEFSEDDPLLVESWRIQDNTAVIENELVMTETDCVEGQIEAPETTIERCTAWTVPEEGFCDNALHVTVDVEERVYTAVARAENDAGRPAGDDPLTIAPNLNDPAWFINFGIGVNGEHIGFARVVDAFGLPADFDCAAITDVAIEVDGNFIEVREPSCSGAGVFGRLQYNWGPAGGGTVTYTLTARAEPVYTDAWRDNCPTLMDECETQGPPACIEGPEERLITANTGEEYPVFRDCWRTRTPLLCAGSVTTDAGYCGELIERGCSPLDSTCVDGTCEHTYECPLAGWSEPVNDCSATTFGLSGIAFDTGVTPSEDFGQAAANLQAMEQAVVDMDASGVSCIETPPGSGQFDCVGELSIFDGEDLRCKKKALGFSNCCSRKGWGLGWADQCDATEERLRAAREAGQCVYVGSYCSEDSIFGCLAKTETHCCFRSKLARIIHEQGRPQLDLGWGEAENPACDGLSAEQLAALDFSRIDFSEYFADAFANIAGGPDSATMQGIIDAYIETLSGAAGRACSQFDPDYPDC